MRLRISRPRKLSTWLFIALALILAPQAIGAAVGIGRQQSQINEAREAGRAVATRLGRLAHLQSPRRAGRAWRNRSTASATPPPR